MQWDKVQKVYTEEDLAEAFLAGGTTGLKIMLEEIAANGVINLNDEMAQHNAAILRAKFLSFLKSKKQ